MAGEKLLAGEIDAAIMLISWDSPVAKQLLADERCITCCETTSRSCANVWLGKLKAA